MSLSLLKCLRLIVTAVVKTKVFAVDTKIVIVVVKTKVFQVDTKIVIVVVTTKVFEVDSDCCGHN